MALRKLHLSNEEDKNTLVGYLSVKPKSPPTMAGPKGKPVDFTRYLACESKNLHESLKEKHGEEYGQALIEGDPELAMEKAGLLIEETQEVFLGADGKMMHAPPGIEEVTYEPAGEEIKRGDAEEVFANVNEELPLVWTKHRIDRREACRKFAFCRTLQITHRDGLTFDYLFDMAKELADADEMVLIGAGKKGRDPLVFSDNAVPYRAFLEGRVKGKAYKLLLHLSNLELKMPAEKK